MVLTANVSIVGILFGINGIVEVPLGHISRYMVGCGLDVGQEEELLA